MREDVVQVHLRPGRRSCAPMLERDVGAVGPTITSHVARTRAWKSSAISGARFCALQVVGVVVAVRQHVGADHDAALDLGAEALAARALVHVVQVARSCARGGRSARRRSATGSTTPRPARSRSTTGTDSWQRRQADVDQRRAELLVASVERRARSRCSTSASRPVAEELLAAGRCAGPASGCARASRDVVRA